MKRGLTDEEKRDILLAMQSMHPDPNFEETKEGGREMNPSFNFVIENARRQIRVQLDQIQVYPETIPKLKEEILRQYGLCYISPGEMVGCVAATSIGEGMTQEALNSVIGSTRVVIYDSKGAIEDEIGVIIDHTMETNKTSVRKMIYSGHTEEKCILDGNKQHDVPCEQEHQPFVEVLDVSEKDWKVSSVNEQGQVHLQKITQLIRHPVYSGLVKVTTASGRVVVATTGESFLTLRNEEIVPIRGCDLEVGDYLPITWKGASVDVKDKVDDLVLSEYVGTLVGRYLSNRLVPKDCDIYHWIETICGKEISTRRIPNIAYTSPDVFIKGLLQEILEVNITSNSDIDYSSDNERLIDGIIYLLGRYYIWCNKSIEINDNETSYWRLSTQCIIRRWNDIVLDEITSITEVETKEIKWVYDFSVENTKNFGILSAVNMRDSFHSSGGKKAELTSGVPRFKELLELSKQMKTPSVTIYFHPKYSSQVQKSNPNGLKFVREMIHTQLVNVKMAELIQSYTVEKNPPREWWYGAFSRLYSDAHRECTHRLRLQLNPKLLFLHQKDMAWIAGKLERTLKSKGLLHFAFSDNYTAQLDIWLDPSNISSCEEVLASKDMDADDREKIMRYITDENKAEMCLRNVILPSVKMVDISGVPGIHDCFPSEPKDMTEKEFKVITKGGILRDVMKLDCVDVRRCESNNVHEIYNLFGIEAAFRFLIKEFGQICKVSRRHLDVMIEWMCQSGKMTSVNRHGQDIAKIGPMAKASFEQPLDAFVKAASTAQTEVISGLSASIATGNLPRIGTGSFQMILDIEKLIKSAPLMPEPSMSLRDVEESATQLGEEYEESPEFDEYEDDDNPFIMDENEML